MNYNDIKGLIMKILLLLSVLANSLALADQKSLYSFNWLDDGEKVFVIQNQEYTKTKKIMLDIQFIDAEGSSFQDTMGVGLVLSYFFNENWGLDLHYKHYINDNSQELTNLLNYPTQRIKPLTIKLNSAKIVHLLWTPFYGKINTFNKIHYFDWGIGAGIGQFSLSDNSQTFNATNKNLTFQESSSIGFGCKSFFKFYATENINFTLEYDLSGFSAITTNSGEESFVLFNDILLSMGWVF